MEKLSAAQVSKMTKLAADALRALSERNQELEAELTHFKKKEYAEKIASSMEEKGLDSSLSFEDKVTNLMKREDLHVVEEAVGMTSPQMKLASVIDHGMTVSDEGSHAENSFLAALAE